MRVRPNDERVARIGPRQEGTNPQPRISVDGDVLGAMDCNVDVAVEKRVFDRRDERPFSPGSVRRTPIALCLDDRDVAGLARLPNGCCGLSSWSLGPQATTSTG